MNSLFWTWLCKRRNRQDRDRKRHTECQAWSCLEGVRPILSWSCLGEGYWGVPPVLSWSCLWRVLPLLFRGTSSPFPWLQAWPEVILPPIYRPGKGLSPPLPPESTRDQRPGMEPGTRDRGYPLWIDRHLWKHINAIIYPQRIEKLDLWSPLWSPLYGFQKGSYKTHFYCLIFNE